jgi:hypothetical protein
MINRKPPKARVSKKRDVHTYAELWHGSRVLLERGQAELKGSKWLWMGSLILTVFSFEAYLNHIGPKLFSCWNIFEKGISPEGKLSIVCERLGIDLPKDRRPRQTVRDLVEFRNKLAHGKTETLESNKTLRTNDEFLEKFIVKPLRQTWEDYCTENNALRAREDIKQVMQLIHEKAKPDNDPLFGFGMYSASASL